MYLVRDSGHYEGKYYELSVPDSLRDCSSLKGWMDMPFEDYPISDIYRFRQHPYYMGIIDIIPMGTKIKCVKFLETGTWLYGGSVDVWVEILDGEYKGTIVSMEDISCSQHSDNKRVYVSIPEQHLLKKVE